MPVSVDPAVSPGLARTICELYGDEGARWLARLPKLLANCERRWSLTLLPPFADLSYNYVAPAVRADGVEVVLKAGVVNPELLTEIAALRLWDGRGSVRLLDADPHRGILLLERLRPGTNLLSLGDEQATAVAAQVMQRLWRPLSTAHPFPTVERWSRGLQRLRAQHDGGTGPLPADLVARAEAIFAEFIASMAEPVLLHGDLHHWNILAAERQPWLALDPKGLAGEPAYEVGAWLRNPAGHLFDMPDPRGVTARRVAQLSEMLGLARERLVGWGLAQAVLSACWSIEDHGHGWEHAIACARLLADLG